MTASSADDKTELQGRVGPMGKSAVVVRDPHLVTVVRLKRIAGPGSCLFLSTFGSDKNSRRCAGAAVKHGLPQQFLLLEGQKNVTTFRDRTPRDLK